MVCKGRYARPCWGLVWGVVWCGRSRKRKEAAARLGSGEPAQFIGEMMRGTHPIGIMQQETMRGQHAHREAQELAGEEEERHRQRPALAAASFRYILVV